MTQAGLELDRIHNWLQFQVSELDVVRRLKVSKSMQWQATVVNGDVAANTLTDLQVPTSLWLMSLIPICSKGAEK